MRHLALLSLIMLVWACQPSITTYDVLIKNGTIYDGSGSPPITGDIAINGDTIVVIGQLKNAEGKATIDATGKAVAPGFINMLSWANVALLEDGRSQSDIRQGVTLEVMGEGRSMGPLNDEMKKAMLDGQGDIKYDITWTTLGEYLQYLEQKGVSTNVASFVGNGTLRQHVIGYDNRPATAEELEAMKRLADQAMQEGAVGMSSSLLYAPSMYASTEELIELSKVVAKYDGLYASHIRNEGDQLLESIDEFITISREAKVHAEIYHLKASGVQNWHKMDSVFQMIEAARAEGLAVTADMYTYPASSTGLHVQLPDWVRDGGVDAALERMANASLRQKILDDIAFRNPPETILFVGFRNPDLRIHIGKRLSELSQELGKTPAETMIDLMVEDGSRIQVVYFSMSEENIRKKIVQPWMSFCSDAGSYSAEGVFLKQSTHPRAYGSFIRVLGKFSRDEGLFPLEDGIRRLTALPAANLKLKRRGMLANGYFADVVIFDPAKVKDNATFEAPHQYAEGIEQVFVNGVQVLQDGEHTGATPGRFVKGPGARD
jgi:N-acyl-D-amino-acid deacylase